VKLAVDQHNRQALAALASVFLLASCTTPQRGISGRIYHRSTHAPATGVQLALVRNPVTYPGIAMLVLGVPQPVTVTTTTTDAKGLFRFTIRSDRQLVISPKPRHKPSDLRADIFDSRRLEVRIDNKYQPSVWFDADSINLPVQ
jgi:hypothetical protein